MGDLRLAIDEKISLSATDARAVLLGRRTRVERRGRQHAGGADQLAQLQRRGVIGINALASQCP